MGFVLLQPQAVPQSQGIGQLVVTSRPPWRKMLVITLIFGVGGIGFLVASLFNRSDGEIGGFVLSGVLVLCAVMLAYITWQNSRRQWLVYENAIVERNGAKAETYPWNEIETITSFTRTVKGTTSLIFALKRQDGKTLKIETADLKNIEAGDFPAGAEVRAPLIAIIAQDLAHESVLDRAANRYWRGERLDFKKFSISKAGFQVGKDIVPWAYIDDIDGDGSVLLIYDRERPTPKWSLWIPEVPNHSILPDLLRRTQERSFSLTTNSEHPSFATPSRDLKSAHQWYMTKRGAWTIGIFVIALSLRIAPLLYQNYYSTQSRLDRAVAYIEQSRYEEALTELNEAAQQSPERAVIYANRCIAYREMGNYEAAIMDCEQSLILRPHYDYAHVNLGLVYYRQEQYERAIADYNAALASDSRYAYAYCARGYSDKKIGELEAALADFTTCFKVAEPEDDVRRANATQEIESIRKLLSAE